MTKRHRKALFACYGGGHVAMLIPLARKMRDEGWNVQMLGLTTAGHRIAETDLCRITMHDLFERFGSERARQHGLRLAEETTHPLIPFEESVAYLGLGYADLEDRLGVHEAASVYGQQGRTSFLPVKLMRQWIEAEQPEVVIATTSPRVERSLLQAASELGVCAIVVVDFHRPPCPWLMGQEGLGTKLCVLFPDSLDFYVKSGRAPSQVVITGNPAFDSLGSWETSIEARRWSERQNWSADELKILWASQVEPVTHPTTGKRGDPSLPRLIESSLLAMLDRHPSWRLILRPHPSESRQLGALPSRAQWSTQQDPLHAVLHSVDMVITCTSTVGLEAALINKPVISVDLSVLRTEFPLSEMGLSHGVRDWHSLELAITDVGLGKHPITPSLTPAGGATSRCYAVICEATDGSMQSSASK